jgi:phosphinothricin acetyltransferase
VASGEGDQVAAGFAGRTDTAITFEIDPPSPAEMAERITAAGRTHVWLVLEDDGRVVGYAYGGPFKARAAYR